MTKALITVIALITATSANSQSDTPYKLIIGWIATGIVVIDYPSLARCEVARAALLEAMKKRNGGRANDMGYCIPG